MLGERLPRGDLEAEAVSLDGLGDIFQQSQGEGWSEKLLVFPRGLSSAIVTFHFIYCHPTIS